MLNCVGRIGLGWASGQYLVFLTHQRIARYAPDADPYLFPATALLTGWGILTIWRLDAGFGLRQAMWLVFCTGVFLVGVRLPRNLDILRRYKYIFLTSGLLLTALTLIFGTNPGGIGPRLWLGCCGFYLQPSEPLKLLLIVYLAAYFADRLPIRTHLFPLLLPTLFLTGLALAILLIQRDLGTASIFIFLYASLVYMASGKRRLLLGSLGLLLLAGLVGYFFVDIIRYRLVAWLDPWVRPLRALVPGDPIAAGSGKWRIVRARPRHGRAGPGSRGTFGLYLYQHRRRNRTDGQLWPVDHPGIDRHTRLPDRHPRRKQLPPPVGRRDRRLLWRTKHPDHRRKPAPASADRGDLALRLLRRLVPADLLSGAVDPDPDQQRGGRRTGRITHCHALSDHGRAGLAGAAGLRAGKRLVGHRPLR